jgi:hypothetical protein
VRTGSCSLGSRGRRSSFVMASACRLPRLCGVGWGRVGMRPRVAILNYRERAVRERADACGVGVLRPTPPRARVS